MDDSEFFTYLLPKPGNFEVRDPSIGPDPEEAEFLANARLRRSLLQTTGQAHATSNGWALAIDWWVGALVAARPGAGSSAAGWRHSLLCEGSIKRERAMGGAPGSPGVLAPGLPQMGGNRIKLEVGR